MPSSNFAAAIGSGLQWKAQREDRQRQQELEQQFEAFANSDNPALDPNLKMLASKDPQRVSAIMQAAQAPDIYRMNAMVKDNDTLLYLARSGQEQHIKPMLENRLAEIQNLGGDGLHTRAALDAYNNEGVQGLMRELTAFRSVYDPDFKQPQQPELQYKEGGLVFNPATGEVSVNETATQHLARLAEKKRSGQELTLSDKRAINGDVTKLLKDTTLIHKTANDLAKLQKMPSGPASIALVFKFMKALDPTSVVREGEFATAENSAGVPEGVRNMYNRFMNGERLGENQIQQFVATAQGLSNSAVEASRTEIGNYLQVYGDSLPTQFTDKVYGRIPSLFEQQELSTKDKPDDPNAINPKSNITPWSEL